MCPSLFRLTPGQNNRLESTDNYWLLAHRCYCSSQGKDNTNWAERTPDRNSSTESSDCDGAVRHSSVKQTAQTTAVMGKPIVR